jgi:hypothetical protein
MGRPFQDPYKLCLRPELLDEHFLIIDLLDRPGGKQGSLLDLNAESVFNERV